MPLHLLIPIGIGIAAAVLRSNEKSKKEQALPPAGLDGRYVDDGDGFVLTLSGWKPGTAGTLIVRGRSRDGRDLRAASSLVSDPDGLFGVRRDIEGESCEVYLPHGAILDYPRPKLLIGVRVVSASGGVSEDTFSFDAVDRRFSVVAYLRPLLLMMKAVAQADGQFVAEEVRYIREFVTREFQPSASEIEDLRQLLKEPPRLSMEEAAKMQRHRFPWIEADAIAESLRGVCTADGPVNGREAKQLRELLPLLGMSDSYLDAFMKSLGTADRERIEECLALLGLTGEPTREQLQAAWRRAAREFHPDKYASSTLPEGVKEMIARRCAEINAAYEALQEVFGYA